MNRSNIFYAMVFKIGDTIHEYLPHVSRSPAVAFNKFVDTQVRNLDDTEALWDHDVFNEALLKRLRKKYPYAHGAWSNPSAAERAHRSVETPLFEKERYAAWRAFLRKQGYHEIKVKIVPVERKLPVEEPAEEENAS